MRARRVASQRDSDVSHSCQPRVFGSKSVPLSVGIADRVGLEDVVAAVADFFLLEHRKITFNCRQIVLTNQTYQGAHRHNLHLDYTYMQYIETEVMKHSLHLPNPPIERWSCLIIISILMYYHIRHAYVAKQTGRKEKPAKSHINGKRAFFDTRQQRRQQKL